MEKVVIPIRVSNSLPEPQIPEPFTEPQAITGLHFEGPNWRWNRGNIDLVRTYPCKTIGEQLVQFWRYYEQKVMRPLQACELKQIEPHTDLWPADWRSRAETGRIFFGGTIYTVSYANSVKHDLIWYAAYDPEDGDWHFGCMPTTTQLRRTDCFACVSFAPESRIPDYPEWPAIPPPRRERQRSTPRETLCVTR